MLQLQHLGPLRIIIDMASLDALTRSSRGDSRITTYPAYDDETDYLFKIVLVGDLSVGKTCALQRFRFDTYQERQGNTLGVDFTSKSIQVDGKLISVST